MYETIPKIRLLINVLLILEVCLGIVLIGTTIFYQRILDTFLTERENKLLSAKFVNVYILGFQMVALYLCSISMWNNIWRRQYSKNLQLLLSIWLTFCGLIIFCGCFTIWTLISSGDALTEGTEMILLKGIDIYYTNPEWKFLWDKLQYTNECCGVHSYRDWMYASWLTENINTMTIRYKRNVYNGNIDELTNQNSRIFYEEQHVPLYTTTESFVEFFDPEYINIEPSLDKQQNREDNIIEKEQTLAPYACCKHSSLSCYENYIPQIKTTTINMPPHLNLTDINTNGCLEQFNKHLSSVMNLIIILILISILVGIIICCLTKYIMATNYGRDYREFNNDCSMFDNKGNALVVIRCPPKVKCIISEEPNTFSDFNIPNISSYTDTCPCCIGEDNNVSEAPTNCCETATACNHNHNNQYIFH